jgi:hypothetical protein
MFSFIAQSHSHHILQRTNSKIIVSQSKHKIGDLPKEIRNSRRDGSEKGKGSSFAAAGSRTLSGERPRGERVSGELPEPSLGDHRSFTAAGELFAHGADAEFPASPTADEKIGITRSQSDPDVQEKYSIDDNNVFEVFE